MTPRRAQALMTAIHYGLIRYTGTASYDGDHPYGNRVIGTFRPRVASEAAGRTGAALCRFRLAHRRVSGAGDHPPGGRGRMFPAMPLG